jgi:Icc protein
MKGENEREVDRRGFLRCLAWVGTGAMWTMASGVLNGLGLARLSFHDVNHPIAITGVAIEDHVKATAAGGTQVIVDNFSFKPAVAAVPVGTTVTWTNRDDVPHNVVSTEKKFASPVLDTDEKFSHTFETAGTFRYYCSIHPKMTGQVVVG